MAVMDEAIQSRSENLARILAEHPKWPWDLGMVAFDVAGPGLARQVVTDPAMVPAGHAHYPALIPDIHHPGMKGWMLHMLREAYGDRVEILTLCLDGTWCVCIDKLRLEYNAPTEGEALAAALLAVWGAS